MRFFALLLLLATPLLSACAFFDSTPAEQKLPGERISILDLQKELNPGEIRQSSEPIFVPPPIDNKSWPQNGGLPHHALQNLGFGAANQVERIWRADIGKGSSTRLPLTAHPIVAQGLVFTLDTRSNVRAFHNQTGKLVWETGVDHPIEKESVIGGGLAYDGGKLFVTSGYNEVLALNPDNGNILWRTTISAGSRAAPTIRNGRVFIAAMNNNAIALSANDGTILWEYEGVGETTALLGAASPAADEDVVIAGFSSGELVALQANNGVVLWDDSLANSLRLGGMAGLSDIRGLPIIAGDYIIAISYGGKILALNKNNGNRLWQREISSAETPWIAGETVYILSADNKLIALNLKDGTVQWVSELPKYEKPKSRKGLISWAGPVMGGGRLTVTGSHGYALEFNPKNGSQSAQWKIGKTTRLSPIIAGGTLYMISEDGSLLAFR